ncbi:transmembrane protein, putative (macronuclear) [Tetrahymena thermophila SB210]|uniref:Transmembrane protein, putative n=1 Tax=Tetrahymena thermophila (strain SB210) TaxID=312017 RepID=Q22G25_TETTS|nr:transmembrane protein, putative [Tetrahymena thermophila SB210]EAR84201.1 transmembrane protein, putative [Tetrahymena thermophila SB210]|eukprot:XP_001031864.1 transmembrane protein, putative [Tetrahymena thermophila SB210]
MNNKIITTLFILAIFSSFVYSDSQCQNHLAYQNVKFLLQEIAQGVSQSTQDKINNFFSQFQNQDPQVISQSALDVCDQNNNYADHYSCCDKDITSFLEFAPFYALDFLTMQQNVVQKLLNNIANFINDFSCNSQESKTKPKSFDDLVQNENLPLLQDLVKKSRSCQASYLTQITNLIRGTLCTVCIGVDQLSEYFDSDQNLYVSQASVNEFQDAVNDSISCFSNLVSWNSSDSSQHSFRDVVYEIVSYYIDPECQNRILGYFQNLINTNLSNSSNYCTLEQIFSIENGCLNSQDLIFQNTDSTNRMRILQSSNQSTGFSVSQKNGSNVFVESKKTNIICNNGCVVISFQGITKFYFGFLLTLLLIFQ